MKERDIMKIKKERCVCQKCSKSFTPERKPRKIVVCPSCKKKPKKFICTVCKEEKKPPKNSREKTFVCAACRKQPVKFKCTGCGAIEKPAKNSRKKTFLCKECRLNKKKLNKVIRSNKTINIDEITNFLEGINFQFSKKGIPYKYYGNIRISISASCGKFTMIVTNGAGSDCYIDTSIQKVLPTLAVIELKPVINTINKLWKI